VFSVSGPPPAGRLDDALATAHRLVVVGGGGAALELAAAARQRDLDVTLVTSADRLVGPELSRRTADHLLAFLRGHGCRVILGAAVREFLADDRGRVRGLRTEPRHIIGGDLVVVTGTGDRAAGAGDRAAGTPLVSIRPGLRLEVVGRPGRPEEGAVLGDPLTGAFTQLRFDGGVLVGAESVNRPEEFRAVSRVLASGTRVARSDVIGPTVDLIALAHGPAASVG
jgi:hypothetical protein